MFEKVSRSLKYDANFFFVHKHIYIYIMDTTTDHFTPLALRMRGNKCTFNGNESFTLPNCHGQTKAAYMNVWLQTKSYKKEKEMNEIE